MTDNHKLVLWDIDGTLLHCGSCGRDALNLTFKKLYNVEQAFTHAKIGASSDVEIVSSIFEYYKISQKDLSKVKETYQYTLREVLDDYKENKILPGVSSLLNYIDQSDIIHNGLMTSNFKIGAFEKLMSLNLEHYFELGGYGDVGKNKLDILNFAITDSEAKLCKKFDAKNIFVIGDTPYDIRAAKHHGAKSIAVSTGFSAYEDLQKEEPDYLFNDLSKYEDIIGILTD